MDWHHHATGGRRFGDEVIGQASPPCFGSEGLASGAIFDSPQRRFVWSRYTFGVLPPGFRSMNVAFRNYCG